MNPLRIAWFLLCNCLLQLALFADEVFTRGPFVQNATTTSIQIIWRTTTPANSCVRYGTTPAMDLCVSNSALALDHVVTLQNLVSATNYFFQVSSETRAGTVTSSRDIFRTLKNSGPVRFYVVSDTAGTNPVTRVLVDQMAREHPDLVLHCGDIVDLDFNDLLAGREYFAPFQPLIKNTPVYLTPGNHDVDPNLGGEAGITNYQEVFYLPTNSVTGTKLFYSFDHGDVHFVSLFNPWYHVYVPRADDAQYTWLTNDLARTTKPWKIIFCHFPAAMCSSHYHDNYNGYNTPLDQFEFMELIAPIANTYGVQLLFSGHDHTYQRFAPVGGLYCIVNGSGGHPLYQGRYPLPGLRYFRSTYSFLRVAVTNQVLQLEAVNSQGVVFDRLTIQSEKNHR